MSYPVQSRSNRSDPDRSPRAQQPPLGRKRGFRTAARERTIAALRRLVARVEGQAFCLISPDGDAISFGKGEPSFTLRVHRPSGLDALSSLDALSVAHAYMEGDLDFEGDLLAAFRYQERFSDFHPAIYLWRRLQPMLVGRPHVNPEWIELHYDAENAQLHAADAIWHTYTPGVYSSDDEALELGADRKLALAFDALRLQADHSLLDVGCGWGGMLRYSAQRGVKVTGLTLSRLQKEYVDQKIAEERLPAKVHYQDFFTFDPTERFDAVSMMGVIEDLSDYRAVMRSLSRWLLTDTYSPRAIERAPPTSPATEAARMGPSCGVAPATPTAMADTDTMPSLAPRTPARSQLSRFASPPECGSPAWVVSTSATPPSQARQLAIG